MAQMVRSIFPITSADVSAAGTGHEATVIGSQMGMFGGVATTILGIMVVYFAIVHVVAVAESGALTTRQVSRWVPARILMAALMVFPLVGGFSTGQVAVRQIALWGIGLASNSYKMLVTAIGPSAQTIAQPVVPGTKTIVSGLIQNELCRALINEASGNANMVPSPRPYQGSAPDGGGYVSWPYTMSLGNDTGTAVCGTVVVRSSDASQTNLSGLGLDMSSQQKTILMNVITHDIRPPVETVAKALWSTRQASSLDPLMNVLESATSDYTQQLSAAATQATSTLRSQYTQQAMQNGDLTANRAITQINALGFSGAGSYYLELARLSGVTLSSMSGMPIVTSPTYEGLGVYLADDLAPLVHAVLAFQARLNTYVATLDPLDSPAGGAELFAGATPGDDGSGMIESVFRRLHLSERVLHLFTNLVAPSANNWGDPFAALTGMGHSMILIAVGAMGAAGLLSSTSGTAALTAFNLLTFNFAGAAATVGGHALMSFLGAPIFWGLMAILGPGIILAFVLPMIPAIMWLMGLLGWAVLFAEAMVAVPLWAFAHIVLQGDGLHGRGLRGYAIIFNLFFRPILMLMGLVLSGWVFTFFSHLTFISFSVAAGFALQQGWLVTNVIGVVVLTCLFVLLNVVLATASFRLIDFFPKHVPTWIGLDAADRMDTHGLAQEAGLIGMAATVRELRMGASSGLKSIQDNAAKTRPALTGPAPGAGRQMDPAVAAVTSTPSGNRSPEVVGEV